MLFNNFTKGRLPLSERMRPASVSDFVGHRELTKKGGLLWQIIYSDVRIPLIVWGPPGSGKTSLGHVIAGEKKLPLLEFSSAQHPAKDVVEKIKASFASGKTPVVVINEFHRYNKTHQEFFLPLMEKGRVIFVFTTTENPSFTLRGSILSRSRIIQLKPLEKGDILELLKRALEKDEIVSKHRERVSDETLQFIAEISRGDARFALNVLDAAVEEESGEITPEVIENLLGKKSLSYDRSGDDRYILISAFIKSIRGSDPDAAIYYLACMLEAGEDPLYIARRMIISAAEDIGLADPRALEIAVAAYHAFEKVGLPEGWLPLAEAAIYLATAPKSNSVYLAYKEAVKDIGENPADEVPLKLRNPVTQLQRDLGYGRNYTYPHNLPDAFSPEYYLPERLKGKIYYRPSDRGYEASIKAKLEKLRDLVARKNSKK